MSTHEPNIPTEKELIKRLKENLAFKQTSLECDESFLKTYDRSLQHAEEEAAIANKKVDTLKSIKEKLPQQMENTKRDIERIKSKLNVLVEQPKIDKLARIKEQIAKLKEQAAALQQ